MGEAKAPSTSDVTRLDRATWPVEQPEITLLELNENSLSVAGRRLARYAPSRRQRCAEARDARILVP
jgi:hypothetical protein